MSKSLLSLLTVALFVLAVLAGNQSWATDFKKETIYPKIAGPVDSPTQQGEAIPLPPGTILQSPGQMVGTTYYDYQTNGSTGNRIVKDASGNTHVCWMNGVNQWSGNRWVYYNFRDAGSGAWSWTTTGTPVNPPPQGDGYTNMDVLSGGEAVITYHSAGDGDYVVLSIDDLPGFGSFTEYNVPDNLPDTVCIWPYVAVDRNDRIHVVAYEYETAANMPQRTIYTRSDDQGANWTEPVIIDTVFELATIVVASEVDDKVAIVYNHPTENPGGMNNIFYIESEDGVTWDWNDKHQVTDYYTNPEEDTISAFADNDALYDSQGNLHIVWNATWTVEGGYYVHAFLYHWSEATGVTEISEHPEMDFTNCGTGGWNLPYAKMSLGVDADDNLYFICTNFDNTDCSVGGFANGELYGCASNDGGATWGRMVNLTNSPTPECWPLECDSDHWSSMAETVDDSIYILYINDKDAGGVPQTEGVATENPVMYLAVHKDTLLRVIGVHEDKVVEPTSFTLMQNYPNPFNASTTIDFLTKIPGQVELAVYNLVGEKVEVLVNKAMPAGAHAVTWDASNVASGVYYYKLSSTEGTTAKRMLLLR